MSVWRPAIVLMLLAATAVGAHASRTPRALPAAPFADVPYRVADWRGADAGPLDAETVRILAADSYLNRTYSTDSAQAVGLYIAYYQQQRPGVSIHSPLHCLPGTGWEAVNVDTRPLARANDSDADVRRLVVRKGMQRAVVLYWYAIHGRMLGNEITSKIWLLHDSIRFGRSDAALVRIVVPVAESIDDAESRGLSFASALVPYLRSLWS